MPLFDWMRPRAPQQGRRTRDVDMTAIRELADPDHDAFWAEARRVTGEQISEYRKGLEREYADPGAAAREASRAYGDRMAEFRANLEHCDGRPATQAMGGGAADVDEDRREFEAQARPIIAEQVSEYRKGLEREYEDPGAAAREASRFSSERWSELHRNLERGDDAPDTEP